MDIEDSGEFSGESAKIDSSSVVSRKYLHTGRSDFASPARQRQVCCAIGTAPWARTPLGHKSALFLKNEAASRGSQRCAGGESPEGFLPSARLALRLNGALTCVKVFAGHNTSPLFSQISVEPLAAKSPSFSAVSFRPQKAG